MPKHLYLSYFFILFNSIVFAQSKVKLSEVGTGWAQNTVNTAVFRKNSLVSDKHFQFISYYDENGMLVVGKRKLKDKKWELQVTPFRGNIKDAHNVISMMLDGDGYLHISFDHHDSKLRYIKSIDPYSLLFTEEIQMLGQQESAISYPQFLKLRNGKILFMYREGESGNGNLVINSYNLINKSWERLHGKLIDGEGKRNAYWQTNVDNKGRIHISWVWRESFNVASNHDLAYAYSDDEGRTWKKSSGELYTLPITAQEAEYAVRIPQKSDLINQTAMSADEKGNPFIASYWRAEDADKPQYKLIYLQEGEWKVQSFNFRTTGFSLGGWGTKQIPISRPQLLVKGKGKNTMAWMIFRDEERKNVVSALKWNKKKADNYILKDLYREYVAAWEPTYDTELWQRKKQLSLFIQQTVQVDGEGLWESKPTPVKVLDWKP